jgi:hypothetical protein
MSTEGDEEGWEYYDDNEVLPDFWQVRYKVRTVRCGWDLAVWLERLTVDAGVTTVLGSILASSDTVESGRQMKQC